MNRYFLAFLVLATAFEFHARELTPDEALQRVQSASTRMNAPRRIAASAPKLVYTVKSTLDDRDATAYLFANQGKEKGYLLLSAEDTFEPVIGYSNTATIASPEDMPENFKWWLSEVGREADYTIRHNAALKAPASLGPAVEPLLKSQWGQTDPYNLYTPVIDGQHAPTGCVATAMAQIMYYHQWPQKPQGSHSYEWNGQTLSINYDELQFDWDKMTDTYDYNSSQESKEAVATLMKAVGYGICMWYAPTGSASSIVNAYEAFKDFFKYNKDAIWLDRESTYFNDWSQGIYSNLSEGMPVLYRGSSSVGAGHVFVCDGYDGNGYFHFNWGWSGHYDGYFLISNLVVDPPYSDDYSYNQNAVINLYPENGHDYNSYLFLRGDLLDVCPEGVYDENHNITGNVGFYIENVCNLTNLELGLGVKALNEDGLKVISLGFENQWNELERLKYATAKNLFDNLNKDKEYECQLYWRNDPNKSWTKVWSQIGNRYAYTLKYSNGRWQYKRDLTQPDTRLKVIDVIINSDNVISNAANNELSFNIKNVTDIPVNTQFKVVFENREHFTEYYNDSSGFEILLEPGESKEYRIDNIPDLEQGSYKLHILDYESGRSFYNSGSDSIKVVQYPEMEIDGLVYAKKSNDELFIKGTSTDCLLGDEIYLPGELTIDSHKYKVIDADLKNIIINNNVSSLIIDTPIEEINANKFYRFYNLKKVRLPQTIKVISEYAFANCSELTEINLPESLNNIKGCAFLNCSKLTGDLIIPNLVMEIGEFAFQGCSGFNGKLVLGNLVQTIGDYAFSFCSGFTGDLVIPNSVTKIGEYAFAVCRGFNDKWVVPDLKGLKYVGKDALSCFYDVICLQEDIPECYVAGAFGSAVVRVKPGFGDKYRAHENWSENSIYEFGDANWSESLTVTDAVADANYITGGYTGNPFDFDCGDINMNGEISIADVTGIIRAVAEYNPAGLDASAMRAPRQTAGTLEADDFLLNRGAAEIGVRLHSERPVVALQADFVCGEGIEIDDIELSPKLAGSHALMLSRFEDEGIVRAIIYSLDNKIINTADELLTLHVSGEGTGKIEAERILASTADANEYSFGFVGGENLSPSGIGEIGSSVRIFGADGCVRILNAEGMNVVIYDIAGRKIKAMTADSSEVACPLQSGLYIVTVGNINAKIAL